MRKIVTAALFLAVASVTEAQDFRGTWTASLEKNGSLQINLSRRHSNNGQTLPTSSFEGLTGAQLSSVSQTPVQFRLRREAGTIAFEGNFKQGDGAGHFTFAPNPQFLQTLRTLGVDPSRNSKHTRTDEEALFTLAVHDVSSNFIRSMQAEGYRVGVDEYVSMRIFKVSPALVAEMRQLGYDKIPHDDLISTQIHKATPAFIRQIRALGYTSLSLDDLVAFRIHKVTPEFIAELNDLGYREIEGDDLVAMRIHKVTPEFIRQLREAGYRNVPVEKLISMRIHRVTPEFIRELREAGYTNVPVDQLISMRIHGLDSMFVKKMNSKK